MVKKLKVVTTKKIYIQSENRYFALLSKNFSELNKDDKKYNEISDNTPRQPKEIEKTQDISKKCYS